MTTKKVFLDEHIGRGLKKDAGRKKVDVDLTEFVDGESIILSGGKLKVPNKPCKRITNLNTLEGITEVGVTCITGMFNKTDNFVPGFPNIQGAEVEASRAATAAEYQPTTTDFDWTGLVTATGNEVIVYITVGDQYYMSMNENGMNANGTLKNATKWTRWQRVDNIPQVAQSSGLDCAAIGALPVRQWKKGTTILAKQDSACVQLSALDSLFQDVGIAISANKYSGIVGEKYNVKYTVTNSGEGKNERTSLIITKPLLGSYTISNQTHTSSGVDKVTKVSDTEYLIEGLARGGTVTVTFDVTATSHGTFQFGGSVDPNSALDTNATNHRASITLSITTPIDPNAVATAECPLLAATMDGKQLWTYQPGTGDTFNASNFGRRSNILWDLDTIAGKSVTIAGAKTVIVAKGISTVDQLRYINQDCTRVVRGGATFSGLNINSNDPVKDKSSIISDYSFNVGTGVLTFGQSCTASSYMILFSGGAGCKWQVVKLVCTQAVPDDGCKLTVNGLPTNTITKTSKLTGTERVSDVLGINQVGSVQTDGLYAVFGQTLSKNDVVTLRLKKNTAYNFTITSSCTPFTRYTSKGAVAATPSSDGRTLTVAVSTAATEQDSLSLTDVFDIIIA